MNDPVLIRAILGFALVKASFIAGGVVSIVHAVETHELSPTVGAIIVAVISGVLGIIGMVLAAWISTRTVRRHVRPQLNDIQNKVGADRRETDETDE